MIKLDRPSLWIFGLVAAVALGWALYSQQAWEDFYITYRASKNLAEGHGLTFTAGERVHSFTSPLGVLLPVAAYLLTGRTSDLAALWIFRLMCILALGGAAILLWRTFRRLFATAGPAIVLVAMLVSDSKTVSFTINGMETAFLLLFTTWALWAVFVRPERLARHLGLAWAGMMWTRPDACVYIAAMALGLLWLAPGTSGGFWAKRGPWLRDISLAAAICAIVYLPWFVWAWWYYGTPVPHTIVAKGLSSDLSLTRIWQGLYSFPNTIAAGGTTLWATFLPSYGTAPNWPALIPSVGRLLALVPLFVFLLPFVRVEARIASLCYLIGHLYLTLVAGFPFPWYVPVVALFGFLTLTLCFGQGLDLAARLAQMQPPGPAAALRRSLWFGAGVFVAGAAALSVVMCRQAHLEMRIIEAQVRGAIGLWLHDQAKSPKETVMLEPLGFIGHFSGLKMYDFPGLCSPEMIAARKRNQAHNYAKSWPLLIHDLKPDWLVLRPFEEKDIVSQDRLLLTRIYTPIKRFDVTTAVNDARWVPNKGFLEYNAVFNIYHLKPAYRDRPTYPSIPVPIALSTLTRKEALGGVTQTAEDFLTHAPAVIGLPLPSGKKFLAGRYGIYEGAYAKPLPDATDGAEFRIEIVAADGTRKMLLQRLLQPATNPADRGSQPFEFEISAELTGTIEFTVTTGPLNQGNYDWAYWRGLDLELEGGPKN